MDEIEIRDNIISKYELKFDQLDSIIKEKDAKIKDLQEALQTIQDNLYDNTDDDMEEDYIQLTLSEYNSMKEMIKQANDKNKKLRDDLDNLKQQMKEVSELLEAANGGLDAV